MSARFAPAVRQRPTAYEMYYPFGATRRKSAALTQFFSSAREFALTKFRPYLLVSTKTHPGPDRRGKPRLLDRLRQSIRARHYSPRTEKAYVGWIKRFIFFHGKRHPNELGEEGVTAFLNYLAVERKVSASTQNQARNALLFLYKNVLDRDLEWLDGIVRAKDPRRLPVVLTREEVAEVLRHVHGTPWLMASTM